jgi:hypothetical protein
MTIELSAAIATTRTSWTLTDDSTFTSPLRSACGVFVQSYKMDGDNNATELEVTGDDDDPETDSNWSIEYTGDGWYKTYYVSIPDFNSASTYAIYDAVFNASDNKVYRSKTNGNTEDTLTNTTYWEEITEPATLANNKDTSTESNNIDSVVYHRVFAANSQYEYGTLLSDLGNYMDADDTEFTLSDYNLFAQWLDAVAIADSRTEVLDGELICRRIEGKFLSE